MTLPMPSSGTCRQVDRGRGQGCPTSWASWGHLLPPHPLNVPPGALAPASSAHQGMVEVEGTDVVGGDVGRSQGTCDLGHNPTLI